MFCIALLNTFSEKELEDFGHLVTCRYFNTDIYVLDLFEVLRKSVLGKRTYDATLQTIIYQKVFPDLPSPKDVLNEKQRRTLQYKINALKSLAEQFLTLEAQKENDSYKYDLLYPKLLERRQFSLFSRHANKDKKLLEAEIAKDATYYAQRYKIEAAIMDYLHQNGRLIKEDNLPDLNHALDLYYLLNKLSLHLTTLSLKRVSGKKEYDVNAIKTTDVLLKYPAYASQPLVLLYVANIKLFETPSHDAYLHLLVLLDEYNSAIPIRLLKHFYTTMINYCMYQINTGQLDYVQNMFDLYKITGEKNLVIVDGFIPIDRLKNMIIIACRVGEFDWAKQLLEQYRKYIRKSVREHVYRFNLGLISFHQKDYETAHEKFSQTGQVSLIYDINVRVLILKCLYETGQEYNEPTIQAFRTAESFFKNHKLLPTRSKKAYKNFIRILINLYRIRHRAGKTTIPQLKEKLNKQEVNIDKQWLMEKIEELK